MYAARATVPSTRPDASQPNNDTNPLTAIGSPLPASERRADLAHPPTSAEDDNLTHSVDQVGVHPVAVGYT